MQCHECGSYIPRGEESCPVCGEPVSDAVRNPRDDNRVGRRPSSHDDEHTSSKPGSSSHKESRGTRKGSSSKSAAVHAARGATPAPHSHAKPRVGHGAPQPASSTSTLLKRVLPTAGVFIVVLAILLIATKGFGLFADKTLTQSGEEISLTVRGTLDQYSWEELSALSHKMAAAADDEQALDIAVEYNLADENGLIYDELKEVTLSDGTLVGARLIDYRHDTKSDGAVTGLTFMLTAPIGSGPVSESTNEGGWSASLGRTRLSSDLSAMLPDDLNAQIVPVSKLTNNVGLGSDPASVTATQDSLWLFSVAELCGPVDWYTGDYDAFDGPVNAEGRQYRYFADTGISAVFSEEANSSLLMTYAGAPCSWWLRTPKPTSPEYYCDVDATGHTGDASFPQNEYAFVVGFCL